MSITMPNYPIGFPQTDFKWKGKTFYETIATIQLNTNKSSTLSNHQLRKALPLSIYRKEIHNINSQPFPKNCNPRISTKISAIMDTPASTTVSRTQQTYSNGLVDILDIHPTTLTAENGGCNSPNACFSPQFNARKRVRSAGMIPKKFNTNKNNDVYNTSTQQYLISRNRSIKQNEYNYIRKGDSGMIPGPGLSAANIYSPAGLSHCYQPMISSANVNNSFSYTWVDGTSYNVTIPDGNYNVRALNTAFQIVQMQQYNYLKTPSGANIFLLGFSYDNKTQSLVLITNVTSQATCSANGYTEPSGAGWLISNLPLTDPSSITAYPPTAGATFINIPDTNFADLIGFMPGIYYAGINETSYTGSILPSYVQLHFKPNNPSFGVQGAVDSSTLTQRVKYETITDGAGSVRSAYGSAAANALAYGVSEQAYTAKTIVGDKPPLTPVIDPRTGQLCKKRFIYRM